MDSSRKQKIMFAGLAALVIGAGSYFMIRDDTQPITADEAVTEERPPRSAAVPAVEQPTRRAPTSAKPEAPPPRIREIDDQPTAPRGGRTPGRIERVKPKKELPAGA